MAASILRVGFLRAATKSNVFTIKIGEYLCNGNRFASTWQGAVTDLTIDENRGFARLTMKNAAGNTLATPLMQELSAAITEIEKTKCRGLVLTSSIKNIFCSGLNLAEFGGPDSTVESVTKYYGLFQDLWFQLFKSHLITIAAINGHAIAGGCGLAIACDYRIMAEAKFGIGFNVVFFGVPIAYYLLDTMILIMGRHKGSQAAILGKIFKPDEALKVGLVDEVISLDGMEAAVQKAMAEYMECNRNAQIASKMYSRQKAIDNFHFVKAKDLERFVTNVTDPEVKKMIWTHLQSVKNKK